MEDVTTEQESQLEKKETKTPRKRKKVEKVDLKPFIDDPSAMDKKVETTDDGKTLVQDA